MPPLTLSSNSKPGTGIERLEVDNNLGEHAGATGLALEPELEVLDELLDRLAVGDLRSADVGVDLELAQQPVETITSR